MESSTQYRKFAEECRHFAQSAKTDEERQTIAEDGRGLGESLRKKLRDE
jgi:hypothetical protein